MKAPTGLLPNPRLETTSTPLCHQGELLAPATHNSGFTAPGATLLHAEIPQSDYQCWGGCTH